MSNLVPFNEIQAMASAVAKSGLFGIKTPDQATALMLIAQAEGFHPAIAARDYHVISGRPTLKADAMLARFQAAGGKVSFTTYTDREVTATFSHPAGGSINVTWTFEMAEKAKLTGKDVWRQYPRQMLRARVISEGIRSIFPGVVVGVYTPEEVQDMQQEAPQERAVQGERVDEWAQVKSLAESHGLTNAMRDEYRKQGRAWTPEAATNWITEQLEELNQQQQQHGDE